MCCKLLNEAFNMQSEINHPVMRFLLNFLTVLAIIFFPFLAAIGTTIYGIIFFFMISCQKIWKLRYFEKMTLKLFTWKLVL